MLIRKAKIKDAASLVTAEKETAQTPGLLVSRPHELTLAAFEKKIVELDMSGRYIVAEEDRDIVGHALLEPMGYKLPLMCSGSRSSSIRVI